MTGSNSAALYAHGGGYAGYFSGNVFVSGNITELSDEKVKKDIALLHNESVLQKVMQLKPKTYFFDTLKYGAMNFPKNRQIGLMAQDVESVFPDLVSEVKAMVPHNLNDSLFIRKNGKLVPNTSKIPAVSQDSIETFKSVNYMALIPVLIGAIQEQKEEIDSLKMQLGLK